MADNTTDPQSDHTDLLNELLDNDPGEYADQADQRLKEGQLSQPPKLPNQRAAQPIIEPANKPSPRPSSRPARSPFRADHLRQQRQRQESSTDMLTKGQQGLSYASALGKTRQLFSERRPDKPPWAVVACVLLRDAGECRVCGKTIRSWKKGSWRVVQLMRYADGGQFDETNAILVCQHCGVCWNESRNFYYMDTWEDGFVLQRHYVLGRRQRGYQNVPALDSRGIGVAKAVRKRVESIKAKRTLKTELGKGTSNKQLFEEWLQGDKEESLEDWFAKHRAVE